MTLDQSVRRELARGFGATLLVILTIVLTNFLIRTIRDAVGGTIAPQDVVLLLGYLTLAYLPMILALSLFVTLVVGFGRMYRDSEMAIWFASGVGLTRFIKPVLATAWPVLLVVALLLLFAWPWVNRSSQDLRDRYQQRGDLSRVTPGVFQSSRDGQRVFFVERDSADGVNARNVFILSRNDDGESVTTARSGRLEADGEQRVLVLERGQRNDIATRSGERSLASFERYTVSTGERGTRVGERDLPKQVATLALLREGSPRSQGELVWRFGLMLASANLMLLGLGLAATNPRRATNWNLLFALLAFVVYYNLVNLSQAWVAGGRVPAGVALLGLHGTAFGAALWLLWWRDHAAVWRPWRRSPRAMPGAAA
jgi:lipopolysaccharide export system permease protein